MRKSEKMRNWEGGGNERKRGGWRREKSNLRHRQTEIDERRKNY